MKQLCLIFFVLLWQGLLGQNIWTLPQCIDYAKENNLDIKSILLDKERADMSEKYAKYLRLPTLNASTGFNYSLGRTIDPTSNQFVSSNYDNQNYNLSSGTIIYNGGAIRHQIKQAQINSSFFANQKMEIQEQVLYSVIEAYYNILIAKENAILAEQNAENNQTQLRRIVALVDAGSRPLSDRQEADAQQANLDYQVMQAQNMVQNQILRLNQLLNKSDDPITDVEEIDIDIDARYASQPRDYDNLEQEMLTQNYSLQRAQTSILQSEIMRDLAKSNYYPTLSFGIQAGTNYSSTFQEAELTGEILPSPPTGVLINNVPSEIITFSPEITYHDVKYLKQLSNNFGYGFGFNLNIPIFNQKQVKANVLSSEIDIKKSRYNLDQTEFDLKAQLQNLLLEIENTWRNYQSSQKLTEYNKIVFENTEKKQNAGASSLFEVEIARTNYQNSFIDQLTNKYSLALLLHRLDYLRGKEISSLQY